ncbi:MAG: Rne/Rng family ribonuclease, partial [Nitrospirae bacterium]|nr:Rne/Rng family ribonuclease [Nitrospirota bacterium]
MAIELLINVSREESRVARFENGIVTEISIERNRDRGIVGNVYKGRVVKVLPGMQAAFVDIGLAKAAFLYVTDVSHNVEEYARFLEEE